jgi:hypothetical protein
MRFALVYSFDLDPRRGFVAHYLPVEGTARRRLERTGTRREESGGGLGEGRSVHRVYEGVLSKREFLCFLEVMPVQRVGADNAGTIGVPGFPPGTWLPAVRFDISDGAMTGCLYATPVAEPVNWRGRSRRFSRRRWVRLARSVMRRFEADPEALEAENIR